MANYIADLGETMSLKDLEKKIGYTFKNENLLKLALTHSSYTNEHGMGHFECNERIEFLGDAVLELASSDYLYKVYGKDNEGDLTKIRASLVCEYTLAEIAREIGIGDYMYLGRGEEPEGRDRDSTISDTLESIIGAIYLDNGFDDAKDFVYRFIMKDIDNRHLFYDSKTILQEMTQSKSMGAPTYKLISSDGPDHLRTFTSIVLIENEAYGTGIGKSKKLSEQKAAYEAILKLKDR